MSVTYDLTVVLPCRNERSTVGICVNRIQETLSAENLRGEIIVVDNASTDGSREIARAAGARTIEVNRRGYGYALRTGIRRARGRIIVMCDSDLTYSPDDLVRVYRLLSEGRYDMVIGDRYAGGIARGAMPLSHKVGVWILSCLGRWRFHTDVHDFHSGVRGLTKEAADSLKFETGGMEYATEMIAVASKADFQIGQTDVKLLVCPVQRKPKLRTIRDGLRHLKYILTH